MSSTTTPYPSPFASPAKAVRDALDTLDDHVELDVPFRVLRDGAEHRIAFPPHLPTPESVTLIEGTLEVLIDGAPAHESRWKPVDGYSGQQGYSGPVMHPSEVLGGRMARDIVTAQEAATYIVKVVDVMTSDGQDEIAGWILLRLDENPWDSAAQAARLKLAVVDLMKNTRHLDASVRGHLDTALGYAHGRMDQGHPPVVGFAPEPPNQTDTAWGFATLYARMHEEGQDRSHPRTFVLGTQSAWEMFTETGWLKGVLEG